MTIAVVGLSWVISRSPGELEDWMEASWGFAKQILPLLLAGVAVAGLYAAARRLGRPLTDLTFVLAGAGAAGMTGAVVAHQLGGSVLVVEKEGADLDAVP